MPRDMFRSIPSKFLMTVSSDSLESILFNTQASNDRSFRKSSLRTWLQTS